MIHCPNMVIKLSMYVGLHDVYPEMNGNLAFWREVKMTGACNFITLGEKCANYSRTSTNGHLSTTAMFSCPDFSFTHSNPLIDNLPNGHLSTTARKVSPKVAVIGRFDCILYTLIVIIATSTLIKQWLVDG